MPDQFDGVKISSFPDASEISNSDRLTGLKSGANTNFTFATIMGWIRDSIQAFFIPNSAKGAANGVASLDNTGKVPTSQLPSSTGPEPATATPLMDGTGAVGTSTKYAREDHEHPVDTNKQAKITASGILKGDGAGGVSAATAGTDYQAPLTFDATPTASSTNPVQSGGVYSDVRTRVPVNGMGKNLLDNAYFGNPVNQRGQLNYQGSGGTYTIDRWKRINSINMTLENGYVHISDTNWGIRQNGIEVVPGQYTLSIVGRKLTSSGNTGWGLGLGGSSYEQTSTEALSGNDWAGYSRTVTINTAGKLDFYCSFNSNSGYGPYSLDILAFKVERGTEQTLYHYENGVLVLNEIPDYGEELAKCQRYYFDVGATSSSGWIGSGIASVTGNAFSVFVPVPVTMTHDNFSVTGTISWVRGEGSDVTGYSLNTTNLYILNNGIGNLNIEKTGGFSPRRMYAAFFTKLIFTAEP